MRRINARQRGHCVALDGALSDAPQARRAHSRLCHCVWDEHVVAGVAGAHKPIFGVLLYKLGIVLDDSVYASGAVFLHAMPDGILYRAVLPESCLLALEIDRSISFLCFLSCPLTRGSRATRH